MKMISLLLTLAIVGFVVYKQLGGGSQSVPLAEDPAVAAGEKPPRVPNNPSQLGQFDAAMDGFMEQQSRQRAEDMEFEAE